MVKFLIFCVFFMVSLVNCQNQEDFGDNSEFIDGEKCNDQDLYDIMMKAANRAGIQNRLEIRQLTIGWMTEMYPMARSMGSICTSRKFTFPKETNHRFCTVNHGSFKCHSIVF
ncbi:unnamed protein product [Caenorhabditis angaria]|uniref:Ground-like domain-containing protein n=1 Tax=Caenorhabditis angaria TaxID=860376 RepID=A0A9P1IND7_9PELO|nr:unnamed protein product [Caenorhabditis angaria]